MFCFDFTKVNFNFIFKTKTKKKKEDEKNRWRSVPPMMVEKVLNVRNGKTIYNKSSGNQWGQERLFVSLSPTLPAFVLSLWRAQQHPRYSPFLLFSFFLSSPNPAALGVVGGGGWRHHPHPSLMEEAKCLTEEAK